MERLAPVLAHQAGVVSRKQALSTGLRSHDVERLLRQRRLSPIHPGVYVDHTGPPTWAQRAWAAVLATAPAALCGVSALRIVDGLPRTDHSGALIHVAVDRDRHLVAPAGVRVHRMSQWRERTLWTLALPRLQYDEALLDVALDAGGDSLDALAVLADAVQGRRTTAQRLLARLRPRARVAHRRFLTGVLEDIAAGACSVLEHGHLRLVERPHGLPRPTRQVRGTSTLGLVFRDVDHDEMVVELDGRLFHDNAVQRDRDFDRDLDVAAAGRSTIRLTYGQVFKRPCATAQRLGRVLTRNGWSGSVHLCGPECAIAVDQAA